MRALAARIIDPVDCRDPAEMTQRHFSRRAIPISRKVLNSLEHS
jgi:hypothetical protein